jgi:hypothetical protein
MVPSRALEAALCIAAGADLTANAMDPRGAGASGTRTVDVGRDN